MSALLQLAERCEKATGPDRGLDVAIFRSIGAPVPFQFANKLVALIYDESEQCYFAPIGGMRVRYEPPAYTASLDAAMTLVPEWASPGVSQSVFHQDWHAWMGRENGEAEAVDVANAHAAAPALALCAAALRARVAGDER